MRRAAAALAALTVLVLLPEPAAACAVCFDANSEIRWSFLATTIFLSLLPLGMVAGTGLWIRRRLKDMEREQGVEGLQGPAGSSHEPRD